MRLNLSLSKLVIAAIIVFGLAGCANDYQWRKLDTEYRNRPYKFSMTFPDGWMSRSFSPESGYYLEAQSPAVSSSKGLRLASYTIHIYETKVTTPPQPSMSKNFKKTGEGKIMIGGFEAVWITYNILVDDKMTKSLNNSGFVSYGPHKVYTIVRPPRLFRITFAATDENTYRDHIQVFDNTVHSLQFWE